MASLKKSGFIALDNMTPWDALALAARLRGLVYGVKVEDLLYGSMSGMELICRLKEMGFKVFADAKVKKTPPAAASSVKNLARCGADLITVHADGGTEMVEACVGAYAAAGVRDARRDEPGMGILAITVLTSLDETSCRYVHGDSPGRVVSRLSYIGWKSGAFGLVCSPHELAALRTHSMHTGKLVTPGLRLAGSGPGRHERHDTPANALAAGADYLVIGDEVTNPAYDPVERIRLINESISHLP